MFQNEPVIQTFLDALGDAAFLVDDHGRIECCNEAACRHLGRTHDEIVGAALEQFEQPGARQPGATADPDREYRTVLVNRAGQPLPVVVHVAPLTQAHGTPRLLVVRDAEQPRPTRHMPTSAELHAAQLLTRIPVMLHSIDSDGRLVNVSDHWLERLGYDRAEVLGHKSLEFLTPASQHFAEHVILPAFFRTGVCRDVPYEFVAKDGHIVDVLLSASCERDAAGRFVRSLAVLIDVTQQKHAAAALRRSEARFRAIFENTNTAIGLVGPDGRIIQGNNAWARMLGRTPEELTTLTHLDVTHPDDRALSHQRIRAVFAGQSPGYRIEKRYIRKDDSVFWADLSVTPLSGANGEVEAVIGVILDITERRLAEAEVESVSRFPAENPSPVLRIAAGGTLLYANKASTPLLDLWRCSVGQPVPDEWRVRTKEALRVNTISELEVPCRERFYSCILAPVEKGHYVNVYGRDITRHKQAEAEKESLEAQLRRAQKLEAVGQLAGGVAHDFNNILTAILGNVELLQAHVAQALPTDNAPLTYLSQIERAALRAASLTRQMLAFSRRQPVRYELIDLNNLLTDMEQMLRRLISENIALHFRLSEGLPRVLADSGQIEQIIMNLVVNARDAMPDGGRIGLEAATIVLDETYVAGHPEARLGTHIVITITDTGCGMTQEVMEHAFEPFFTTKPVGEGTGLGLATVYGIVRQLGGHITVHSEVGRGSTFRVFLPPVALESPADRPPPVTSRALTGHETVLVCEDDETVRGLASRFLSAAGYTVITADCGEQALSLATDRRERIDLLLTDVIMPDMNGRVLAHALAAPHPEARTLYMSGYTADVIAHHGIIERGVTLLDKPFSRRVLLEHVRQVLDEQSDKSPT